MAQDEISAAHNLIDDLTTIVSCAAAAILDARARGITPRIKPDGSPVTAADEASEALILERVSRLLPGLPIASEEAAARGSVPALGRDFILVDPLDGTREFIAGRDEFCINLGIVSDGRPHLGIIAAPARGLVWRTAAGREAGSERLRLAPGSPVSAARDVTPIRPRPLPANGMVAAVSRSHLDARTD